MVTFKAYDENGNELEIAETDLTDCASSDYWSYTVYVEKPAD